MGNSEVGHLTIGSGRRLYQDLMRVNRAIADGSLAENPALQAAFARRNRVHLLGLVSQGGVHSHIDHLRVLLDLAPDPDDTWIHAFTDGRDVSPHAAREDLATLPLERIATVLRPLLRHGPRQPRPSGRRGRWTRWCGATATTRRTRCMAVEASYEAGVTDEFIEPVVIDGTPRIEPGDTAIFFNFRPDRARQLSRALLAQGVDLTSMTRYEQRHRHARDLRGADGRGHAGAGARAERDPPAPRGRDREVRPCHLFLQWGPRGAVARRGRILVPSPRDVPSYDLKPGMAAEELAERFCAQIGDGYGFGLINFANPDMVGHTGVIPAVVEAVETTDRCLGRVVETRLASSAASASSPPITETRRSCSTTTACRRTPPIRRTPCR